MTTVGVLGGGQLGRMLALAAAPLGIEVLVVEPSPDPPAAVAAEVIAAPYGDPAALAELARRCDVVTVELEGVPAEALAWLANRLPVRPGPAAVVATQDRLAEKQALAAAEVPTAPWAPGRRDFVGGTIVKARRGGYDGRSQERLLPGAAAAAALAGLGEDDVISEGVVAFDREMSIVAARDTAGAIVAYPLVETRHHAGILRSVLAPAPGCSPDLQARAEAIASGFLSALDYVGVAAIELFQVGGDLVANEVAPRVHNSGHWTIEGAVTSQFEQHLRAVTGLPLGSPEPAGVSAMVNLIGADVADLAALAGHPRRPPPSLREVGSAGPEGGPRHGRRTRPGRAGRPARRRRAGCRSRARPRHLNERDSLESLPGSFR